MATPLFETTVSQEELQKLIDMYKNNKSLREIEKETGYSRATLSRVFTRLGVKTTTGNHYRKYFFDFDYFSVIDNAQKAYWLGFLYADGCVLPQNKYGEQAFKLVLGEKDIDSLRQLKEDLHSTYPIRYDYSKNKKNPSHQVQVLLEQRSQKTVNDLKKLGCFESKSLLLKFPIEEQVPIIYVYDFIRGYFDGDGSITVGYTHKNCLYSSICIVGTKEFISTLSTFFTGGSVVKDSRKENSYYFKLGGNLQVLQAYHLMYNNATRYMQRKYDKFQILVNKYSES